ncbi:1-deoxy-D-xylulose-5-phosphate reductoisomerase [bacterium]|nr:1-deoxy-D-xylulose-5-phosphate reductoisomerase [bacterium]
MSGPKRVTILGSTGSIGRSTLDVVRMRPERFRVEALVAGTKWEMLLAQVREFRPRVVGIADAEAARKFRQALAAENGSAPPEVIDGEDAAREIAAREGVDLLVNALVGSRGLEPTLEALESGTDVAIANKETLVVAGELVLAAVQRGGAALLPLDSELSAIHQCLRAGPMAAVRRILLTASGGPFRELPPERFAHITAEDALRHPTWDMGPKITVDCATMMNKGLEVIETHFYFGVPYERIDVLVHPQSVVHSMVEFVDSSVMAQLSEPDMRLPIQYALTWPERLESPAPRLDLAGGAALAFEDPDPVRFPCLRLAREAGEAGGAAPAVLNAANEVAVDAFLGGRVPFTAIPAIIEECLGAWDGPSEPGLENFRHADGFTRAAAERLVARHGARTATPLTPADRISR